MKRLSVLTSLLLTLATACLGNDQSQQPSATAPSLGELARHLKEKREKAFVKSHTVFTNDNLPARPAGEGPTAATGMASSAAETKPEGTESKTDAASASKGPPSDVRGEKYYRTKMKELQSRLDLHKRELEVLQQKLSQNQIQFYQDPNKTLLQEYNRSDVNKLSQQIDKKKAEVSADEQAIEALREQLRHDGGDPGWLR